MARYRTRKACKGNRCLDIAAGRSVITVMVTIITVNRLVHDQGHPRLRNRLIIKRQYCTRHSQACGIMVDAAMRVTMPVPRSWFDRQHRSSPRSHSACTPREPRYPLLLEPESQSNLGIAVQFGAEESIRLSVRVGIRVGVHLAVDNVRI